MLLSVGAILVPVAAVALGAWITLRAMRCAAEEIEPRCALCGKPGEMLTSFQCPGCGHDVRERGLIVRRGRTPAAVMFIACALALLITVAAAIGTALSQRGGIPPVFSFSVQVGFSPTAWLPQKFRTVQVTATGIRRENGYRRGRAWLDLELPDGAISTMELDLATRAARITPADGNRPFDSGPLDRKLLERWMDESGIEQSDSRQRYLDEFEPMLAEVINQGTLPRHPMEVMKTAIMVGGGGGASVESAREQWQLTAIIAPLAWLVLTWLILSRGRLPQPQQPAMREAAA